MKTAMKDMQKEIQSAITDSRKEYRKALKAENRREANRLEHEIEQLEKRKKYYMASSEPVQFANGFVINGKLLKQFIKKLPALELSAVFVDDTLEIRYKAGRLTLLNLEPFYTGMKLPKGEDLLEELGIAFS
ncbi:hypothetical protein ACFQ38_00230 [Sporosarcina contaminans]|uniref:Uncharacterized protein n=1 Tax=Sporosarcina contaminans TaxID=633403 RepID=A0ABW3TSU1_9BACL